MEVTNFFTQRLLEEWASCENGRYPVLVVIPSTPDKLTPANMLEFAELIDAEVLDFEERYSGQLSSFIGRAAIVDEILVSACTLPVVVTNIEYFYDKWKEHERIDFVRHLLRRDGHRGIVLLLYADEDFSSIIKVIPPNNRGIIWNP